MSAGPANDAGPASQAASPAAAPSAPAARRIPVVRCLAVSVMMLGALTLGFLGYLFGASRVQEANAQTRLYATLAGQLGNELAPLGPTAPGNPVAILDIPAIGVHNMVVVEGTSAENLMRGPGHLRSTPLPGQAGTSVLFGRRATFGAPFARIGQLRPGDMIAAVTQQGISRYRVAAIGDSQHPVEDPAANRLVLLTASSAAVPAYYLEVDADLTTPAHAGPADLPPIGPAETALAGDQSALVLTLLWALALAGVAVGSSYLAARRPPWPVYLAAAPVAAAVLWNLYQALAALLPNLY